MEEIVNKVASSGLITIDLETLYSKGERAQIDLKSILFQGLILREKDLRDFIKDTDWSIYRGKFVAIYCSADAIIPTWAYLLLVAALEPYAAKIVYGNSEQLETQLYLDQLAKMDLAGYKDAKIVIKGCGELPVPHAAFVELMRLLRPIAKSIMYGEPCSTVPLYKQPKN